MSQPLPIDDEDGAIFLSPRQPLLTPSKAEHRTALATRTNTDARAGASAGTKRKSTPLATPLRPNTLTPLKITQSAAFDRLAPLPAPKFNTRTPQTKGETDVYLTRQTATLTRLRLSDRHGSDGSDEFCGPANDSGCELDEDDTGHGLFLSNKSHHASGKQITPLKALAFHAPHVKGKGKEEEVAEAVSPGGHITKRRARSRPLSSDLLEYSFKAPQSPTKVRRLFQFLVHISRVLTISSSQESRAELAVRVQDTADLLHSPPQLTEEKCRLDLLLHLLSQVLHALGAG